MTNIDSEIGRVCPYAAQTCTRVRGCDIFSKSAPADDTIDDKLRALNCARRGVHLFANEVKDRELKPQQHTMKDRDRYARSVRAALHTRRRRLLQLPMVVDVAT